MFLLSPPCIAAGFSSSGTTLETLTWCVKKEGCSCVNAPWYEISSRKGERERESSVSRTLTLLKRRKLQAGYDSFLSVSRVKFRILITRATISETLTSVKSCSLGFLLNFSDIDARSRNPTCNASLSYLSLPLYSVRRLEFPPSPVNVRSFALSLSKLTFLTFDHVNHYVCWLCVTRCTGVIPAVRRLRSVDH